MNKNIINKATSMRTQQLKGSGGSIVTAARIVTDYEVTTKRSNHTHKHSSAVKHPEEESPGEAPAAVETVGMPPL